MTDKQALKDAFTAGYKTREIDVREDDQVVERIIEREFEHYYKHDVD